MLRRLAALISAAVILSGCVSGPVQNGINTLILDPKINDSVQKLGSFTIIDLQNADAIAVKAGDSLAHACFPTLIAFVQGIQASTNGAAGNTVSGAFSAFEAARTAASGGAALVSAADVKMLETACGPLIVDVQQTPARFMANLANFGAVP